MKDIQIVLATKNLGKVTELTRLADIHGVEVTNSQFPKLANLNVEETGKDFKENALLKLKSALTIVNKKDTYVVADDSGLEIPKLGNEPGVHTRRWAGYEMSDQEIIDYCVKKMAHLQGDDRGATFKTVLAVNRVGSNDTTYYTGELPGIILERPQEGVPTLKGFPFRSLFFLPQHNKMIYELQNTGGQNSFVTHREKAFTKMLKDIRSRV